jgi:putative hemolysin
MWGAFFADRLLELALLAALLGLSAFFSGSETALFSLSPGQLYRLRRGGRGARTAAALMARPQEILHSLLLGNLLVNVAYATISAVMVLELARPQMHLSAWVPAAASLVPVLVLILVGEVLPKMLAMLVAERWATLAAAPMALLKRAALPVITALHRAIVGPLTQILAPRPTGRADISSDELAALLDLSAKRGILDRQTNVLLQEIVELTDLRVRDVMVPRVDMICYDLDAPRAGLVKLLERTKLRRVPVYEKDVDHVVGVVHAKRVLFHGGVPLREAVVKVPFVPEAANLERTLTQLRAKRSQMAIVVDEYGGTAGLVTMQDILEEIVGDIPDPHEEARGPAVQEIAPGQYVLDGNLAIHEWDDAFDMELSGKRISTIGGFVTSLLGRIPAQGDEVTYRNLHFTVRSMRRRRVESLELRLRGGPT